MTGKKLLKTFVSSVLLMALLMSGVPLTQAAPQEIYQAEAAYGEYMAYNSDVAGYTGTGFTQYWDNGPGNTQDGHVRFDVEVPEAGVYKLEFRWYTRMNNTRRLSINNGSISILNFTRSATNVWEDMAYYAYLNKGVNAVKLTYYNTRTHEVGDRDTDPWLFIDYLKVYYLEPYSTPDQTITLSGVNSVADYTDGWVGNVNGQYVDFTVTVPRTAVYELNFFYANSGSGASRELIVNGAAHSSLVAFPAIGPGWSHCSVVTVPDITLSSGDNTIRLANNTAKGTAQQVNLLKYLGVSRQTNVSVSPAELTLDVTTGETGTITATVQDGWGNLTFESSDPAVASVTYVGNVATVTPVGEGEAIITASASEGGVTETAGATVTVIKTSPIFINKGTLSLDLDTVTSDTITATVVPGWSGLTFTSDDPAVASVTNIGNVATVTAQSKGKATITATVWRGSESGSVTASVTVTDKVTDQPPPIPTISRFNTKRWDAGWFHMEQNLQLGQIIYTFDPDPAKTEWANANVESYGIRTLPEKYIGSDFIVSRLNDRKDIFFFAEQDIDVYAAINPTTSGTTGWTNTGDKLIVNSGYSYDIYKRTYSGGGTVVITPFGASGRNFFLMILPADGSPAMAKALTNKPVIPEGAKSTGVTPDDAYKYYLNDVFNKEIANIGALPLGYASVGASAGNTVELVEGEIDITKEGQNFAFRSPYTVSSTNSATGSNGDPTDGNAMTWWQSNGVSETSPGILTLDLQRILTINKVTIKCPTQTSTPWSSSRTQVFEIQGSEDGITYTTIVPRAPYLFARRDRSFGQTITNAVDINFAETSARYVRIIGYSNTNGGNSSSTGTQIGVAEVYGPVQEVKANVYEAGLDLAFMRPFSVNHAPTAFTTRDGNGSPTDHSQSTYWQSANFLAAGSTLPPAEMVIELERVFTLNKLTVTRRPSDATRTQTLQILGSTDGVTYTQIVPPTSYSFTVNINSVDINFAPTQARYVKIVGTASSAGNNIQICNVLIYGPAQALESRVINALIAKPDMDAPKTGLVKALGSPVDGKVILETRVLTDAKNQSMNIPIVRGSDGKTAVSLAFCEDGYIRAWDGSALVDIMPYTNMTWYPVKLVIDVDSKTYDVWVNHLRKAQGLSFVEAASDLGAIEFSVDDDAHGLLKVDYLKLYDDPEIFIVDENFNDIPTGSLPGNGWGYTYDTGLSSISVAEVPFKEDKSLRIVGTGDHPAIASRYFPPVSGDITISAKIKPMTANWATTVVTDSSGKVAAKIAFYKNSIFVSNGDNWVYVCDQEVEINYFAAANWHYIKLVLNTDTKRYDFFVNGGKRIRQAAFLEDVSAISCVGFRAEEANELYVDNIRIYDSASLSRGLMPGGNVFNVRDFGAVGDGITDDTAAIRKAIHAAAYTGGTVLLENGVFRSGQIMPESYMTLFIDPSAEISFNMSRYDYNKVNPTRARNATFQMGRGNIYMVGETNAKITGGGTLNCNGVYGWDENDPYNNRPSPIYYSLCDDTSIDNINIVEASFWSLVPLEVINSTVRNVNILNNHAPNRDGINPTNSSNMTIENCQVVAGDDALCPKSSNDVSSHDIDVRNVYLQSFCNGVKCGTDSYFDFRNYTFEDVYLRGVGMSGITLQSSDGSEIENFSFKRVEMIDVDEPFCLIVGNRYRTPDGIPDGYNATNGSPDAKLGYIRNISFEDVRYTEYMPQLWTHQNDTIWESYLVGRNPSTSDLSDGRRHWVSNISFKNVYLEMPGGFTGTAPGWPGGIGSAYPEHNSMGQSRGSVMTIRWADNVTFENCEFKVLRPDTREMLAIDTANYTNNVIKEPYKPLFVLGVPDMSVYGGARVVLPKTVQVLLENNDVVDVDVLEWVKADGTAFDPEKKGTYFLETLLAPHPEVLTNKLKAELMLYVEKDDFSSYAQLSQTNDDIIAQYRIGNSSEDETLSVMYILAQYAENGMLISIKTETVTVPPLGIAYPSITAGKAGKYAKAFIWAADTYVPLCEACMMEIQPPKVKSFFANLALNVPVRADSAEAANPLIHAVDGDPATRWAAGGGGYPRWIEVDLGDNCELDTLNLDWFVSSTRRYQYRVWGRTEPITDWGSPYPANKNFSIDSNYTLLADKNGSNAGVGPSTDDISGKVARYVAIEVINTLPTAGSGSASIFSIEISGWKWE